MGTRVRFELAVVGMLLTLVACGGVGGGSAVPSVPGGGSHPQSAQAAVSFFVPHAASAARMKPNYLPSTTQSIVISVNNADGSPLSPAVPPTVANVSPTAPGCSSVSGGIQCTVTVATNTGTINFSVSAYDAPNGAGNILASGTATATIGAGPNTITMSLGNAAVYGVVTLSGGMGTITIDHQQQTIVVQSVTGNPFTTNGSYTVVGNGVYKITVLSTTDPSGGVGDIAYLRELSNGMIAFVATNTTSPSADGSSSPNADWGVGTAMLPCQTSGTFNFAGVSIEGPAYAVASTTSYTIGTATFSSSGVSFTGTNYLFNGSSNGSANSGGVQACSNGVYSQTNQGAAIPGVQGLTVVSNNGGQSTSNTTTDTGNIGFNPGSITTPATLNLAAISSQTYDAFEGVQSVSGNTTIKFESPSIMTPSGANTMTACPYTNFEGNAVSTSNCQTITLTGQIGPGLVTGNATTPSTGTTPFIATVGQINGKYVIVVLPGSTGGGVNIVATQH
ncbi:MAG TPA: hypothetical protein VFN49_00080 [Candidatus Aquilonibacter sp.]|nr:hypothetical protein [Candidatus Aquilonibacter sp.]